MKKLAAIIILFIISCTFAGLYGALHDQLTYSISSEYYTKFKFYQFNIPPHLQNRIGVAIVGWLASWWMGIVIGLFVIPFGVYLESSKSNYQVTLKALGMVALAVIVFGIIGLFISSFSVNSNNTGVIIKYGNVIADNIAFKRVGTIHGFSYLGSVIGILFAWIYILWKYKTVT